MGGAAPKQVYHHPAIDALLPQSLPCLSRQREVSGQSFLSYGLPRSNAWEGGAAIASSYQALFPEDALRTLINHGSSAMSRDKTRKTKKTCLCPSDRI